ncbi:uncharacterized protein LOC144170752 [Haemaphysalis longicornis]
MLGAAMRCDEAFRLGAAFPSSSVHEYRGTYFAPQSGGGPVLATHPVNSGMSGQGSVAVSPGMMYAYQAHKYDKDKQADDQTNTFLLLTRIVLALVVLMMTVLVGYIMISRMGWFASATTTEDPHQAFGDDDV